MKLPKAERERLAIKWTKVLLESGIAADTPEELLPTHLTFDVWAKKQKRVIESPEEFIELKKECIAVVKFYVDKAVEKCGIRIPYPRVAFDLKGRTAGTADFQKNLIRFSPTLLRENANHFLEVTTGHEVAHLIARNKNPNIDPHGVEWGRVMWAFNLPATRCHNYDTTNVMSRVGKARVRPKDVTVKVQGGTMLVVANARVIEFD